MERNYQHITAYLSIGDVRLSYLDSERNVNTTMTAARIRGEFAKFFLKNHSTVQTWVTLEVSYPLIA